MIKFCYSLFSGCGGSDRGMAQAGYTPLGGVEHHPPAADIYDLNHEFPLTRANILDVDRIPSVDLLWASPPCQSHSIANQKRGETDNDIALAQHVAKLMVESRPRHIAIENVRAYGKSKSLAIISKCLITAGYDITSSIECAANYGTPSTRERFIFRATLGTLGPIVQTHANPVKNQSSDLPKWNGWWDAIAHLVDELEPSHLTENQIKSFENWMRKNWDLTPPLLISTANAGGNDGRENPHRHPTLTYSKPAYTITAGGGMPKILIDGAGNKNNTDYTIRNEEQPAHTVTASHSKHPIRVLIERVGYYNGNPGTWQSEVPSPTIRASQHIDDKGSYRVAYNIVDGYDCYKANIRCLASWQSFPTDYNWGKNRGEAGRCIGNAVPPKLAQAVALSFS